MDFYISKLNDADSAYDYLAELARNFSGLNESEVHEYVLNTLAKSTSNQLRLPEVLSAEELPLIGSAHFDLAKSYLHALQPNAVVITEDEIGVLGESFMSFPKGTAFIKRRTKQFDCYWFLSCVRIKNKKVNRVPCPDEELERRLLKLPNVNLVDSHHSADCASVEEGPAAVMATLASTIAMALVGVVVKKIGTMALDYVVRELGIDPVEDNEKDYKKLTEFIKKQQRQQVIDDMRRLLNSVVLAMNDYNTGTRNINTLAVAYERANQLLGHFLEEEKGRDTTIIRANALVLHLAALQEFAVFYGGVLRYTGYQSVVQNAQKHSRALLEMRDASTSHRISLIDPVRWYYVQGTSTYRVYWYDQGDPTFHDDKKVVQWDLDAAIQEFNVNRTHHLESVRAELNEAFKFVTQTIHTLRDLGLGIIQGSKLSVANQANIWMTLHGMVFRFSNGTWKPEIIDLTDQGQPLNLWFSEVSVGADGTVIARFKDVFGLRTEDFFLCEYLDGKWTVVGEDAVSIGVGNGNAVWKVNNANQVFQRVNETWVKVTGKLTQVTVGADGAVWGLDEEGKALRYNPVEDWWDDLGGSFSCISAGSSMAVWATGKEGNLFQYTGDDNAPWDEKEFKKVVNVSVGEENIPWMVDESGHLYRGSHWEPIHNRIRFKDITVADSDKVHCLDLNGAIYRYNQPEGSFTPVDGPPNAALATLSGGVDDNLCGIQLDSNGIPWTRRSGVWESGGDSAIGLAYGDTTWGLFWNEGFVNYWEFQWHHVYGEAGYQISAGTHRSVWLLKTIPGIPTELINQNFVPIGTRQFVQMSVGSPVEVCGLDQNGDLFRLGAYEQWQYLDSGAGLTKVSLGADGTLYAINRFGGLLRYDPTTFHAPLPVASPFQNL